MAFASSTARFRALGVSTPPFSVTTLSCVSTSIRYALTVSSAASFALTAVVTPGSVCATQPSASQSPRRRATPGLYFETDPSLKKSHFKRRAVYGTCRICGRGRGPCTVLRLLHEEVFSGFSRKPRVAPIIGIPVIWPKPRYIGPERPQDPKMAPAAASGPAVPAHDRFVGICRRDRLVDDAGDADRLSGRPDALQLAARHSPDLQIRHSARRRRAPVRVGHAARRIGRRPVGALSPRERGDRRVEGEHLALHPPSGSGLNLLAPEYRGFSGLDGVPTEAVLDADAHAAYDYLRVTRHIAPGRIVIYGWSLAARSPSASRRRPSRPR